MKYIFLDIDGVLNSDNYMSTPEFKESIKGYKNLLDVINNVPETHIDPVPTQLMNILVEKSGAKVVLSSTWRLKFSKEEMTEILKKRGAMFEISDVTPAHLRFSSYPRRIEIKAYLDDLKEKPEGFVIIDDHSDADYAGKFVKTKEASGFLPKHLERALEILGVK